ncbi:MAG TPA: hypothetical protein VHE60_14045 [Pyrinomonadaceae bacterium]|nr:hypothetical protein [Pyrinomonadaceae bacterium]
MTPGPFGHPHPQMRPQASTATTVGNTTYVSTGQSLFPKGDPFKYPPGTNFLPTIYTNMFDGFGKEMPNTLPSTPDVPYNLHDGEPVVSKIDPASPTDDLLDVLELVKSLPRDSVKPAGPVKPPLPKENKAASDEEIRKKIQRGLDIIEGNPVPDRVYSGLPLLHYKGPEKCKKVIPIRDATGKVIGGNVNVHQVWYDIHIESDTAFLDTTEVNEVPWTITYTVDVLNRGHDDFSPFVMYYDDPALSPPGTPPLPHIGMDQSYFNMDDGTRTVFKIKMAPGKYYSLTYTWGWRNHPPRVQVSENACKRMKDANGNNKTLVQWETDVFGENPSANESSKLKAIAKIGDLAPEKRMWSALRIARQAAGVSDYGTVRIKLNEALDAYHDWRNRNQLPRGVQVDRNADVTLFYVNNTIYAEIIGGGWVDFTKWTLRGTTLKITLLNGDYFEHGYQNVDFGGARGWENQFQSSVKSGGSGCWFTFGRAHWWMNLPAMIVVPPASPYNELGLQKVQITYNYEPSRRLRFYQFDPVHHDVAVFSVH